MASRPKMQPHFKARSPRAEMLKFVAGKSSRFGNGLVEQSGFVALILTGCVVNQGQHSTSI